MRYELFYWSGIQGRGEFVRLALVAGRADWVDVSNETDGGDDAVLAVLADDGGYPPFAPPVLKAGGLRLAQMANILQFLAPRLGLVDTRDAAREWANQLQLTLADAVAEAHDVHHPLSIALTYEQQRDAACARAKAFTGARIPKFLGYFADVLRRNPDSDRHLIGARLSYVDLSLFQLISGLRYAFPHAMRRVEREHPALAALVENVAEQPAIAEYLISARRQAFNENGIFRHYPELDPA